MLSRSSSSSCSHELTPSTRSTLLTSLLVVVVVDQVTLRESGTYVSPRQRLRNLHGSAVAPRAHKGRRPRRIVDVGHSSMRPGASPRRGTFFGLYQQGEASAQKKQRAVDGRRTARVSAQRPAMGTPLWDERERGIRYAYIFRAFPRTARLLPVSPRCCSQRPSLSLTALSDVCDLPDYPQSRILV